MRLVARMLLALAALIAFSTIAATSHAQTTPTPTPPPTPGATPGGSLRSVEGITSTIFQERQSSFSGIGVRVRVRLPQLIEGFSVAPMIEYWRNRSTLKDFGVEATRKDATLGALFRYDLKREGWQPYFGTGMGLHFLSSELDAPSLGFNDASESLMKGGVILLGGIKFGLAGKLGNLIELEYHGLGEHSQTKFNWGLSYDF
ncbi:MAG TPA: hypothetical protein VFQ05_12425 [Candidatus Eisenbacteria bacterium]|nr:hypothetical protein [Candidatus Eisenbacteria bacterium]